MEYGFAFGEGGYSLKDKSFIVSTTTGTPKETYRNDGMNRHTLEDFLQPIEQTATLCNMIYKKPIASYDMMAYTEE